MKTLLLLFLILLITSPAFGQATNTFPSTGNAGVGTTTPADLLTLYTSTDTYPLHVIGDGTGGGIVMNGFYNGPDAGGGFHGFFARGSYASPSIVQSGDRLGYYISSGYVGAAPVSYTHLDVYKRQLVMPLPSPLLPSSRMDSPEHME